MDADRLEPCVASGTDGSKSKLKSDIKQFVNSLFSLAAAKYFKLESENWIALFAIPLIRNRITIKLLLNFGRHL